MKCMYDVVVYNGVEVNAYKQLKAFGYSLSFYYRRRNLGMSPQEAFDACISFHEQKRNICIKEEAKKNNVSSRVLLKELRNNKPLQTIVEEQREKKAIQVENLAYLRKIGLPQEYSSLVQFCKEEKLKMVAVFHNIQHGMNLYDAVLSSLEIRENYISINNVYIFCGIQLVSLASKYSLDYNQMIRWLKKGYDYIHAIEREVFARCISKNIGGRINYLWNIYQEQFSVNKTVDLSLISTEELQIFVKCYSWMQSIKRDLIYYQFLEKINILFYSIMTLDKRVQTLLLNSEDISFSLCELYYILDFEEGLMQDFVYLQEAKFWVYRGNREVLRKLKKPNN